MQVKNYLLVAATIAAAALTFVQSTFGETVSVGAGSYLVGPTGKGDPIRGPNLKSIPTQQWFSNLAFKGANAANEYPHPLVVRPGSGGLSVFYPGPNVGAGNGGITGGGMPKTGGDLVISGTEGGNYGTVALDGYSDWFINVAFLNGDKGMHLSYGHGSPFIYATYDNGGASISASGAKVFAQAGNVLGITTGKASYALFAPTGTTWSVDGGKFTCAGGAGKNYFSVAVLPDESPETLALFKKYAYAHVVDSKTEWKLDNTGHMRVTFNFITKQYEGTETGTVTALYPHQWKYVDEKASTMTKQTYASVRGTMKIATGSSFTTATPIQGILPALPAQGVADKSRLEGYLSEMPNGGGTGETYGSGKHVGKLSSYASIAEVLGDDAARKRAVGSLKNAIENWLTATEGEKNTYFVYNPKWGNLTGVNGGFGADWPFNDHHFHYGYLIRAAAEIARLDPEWAAKDKWGGMVNMLIREVASPDRADKLFPYSRCFDRYEGHGWASGDAGFEAGNNNESSSESMNCWYGIAMWGAATGDIAMRDYGLYMFTSDMTAIEEYWFDVSDTNFPKSYPHESVGMVWGNGAGWGTWFSGDPNKIVGIQFLPYTPGSVYLIRYQDYVKRASPQQKLGGDWNDLMYMFQAGADPVESMKYVDANRQMKVEEGNSRAFMYQWCSTLNTLGLIDRTVTADYPIYNVYNKDGKKTYAVYNFTSTPITVKFTDGKVVNATTKGMTVVGP